jgi:hypothetical protein
MPENYFFDYALRVALDGPDRIVEFTRFLELGVDPE